MATSITSWSLFAYIIMSNPLLYKDADSHWMWPQHKIPPLQFSTSGAWYFFLFILVSELQPDFHTRATRCVGQLFKRHSFYAPYFFDQCSDTKTGVHWHCLYCCPRTHLYTLLSAVSVFVWVQGGPGASGEPIGDQLCVTKGGLSSC